MIVLQLTAKQLFPFIAITPFPHVPRPAELILWNPDFKKQGYVGILHLETALQPWPAALQMQVTSHKGNLIKDGWTRWAYHPCYKHMCLADSRSVSSSPGVKENLLMLITYAGL